MEIGLLHQAFIDVGGGYGETSVTVCLESRHSESSDIGGLFIETSRAI